MLRITTTESGTERKWILEGQLAGPFVAEFNSAFESAQSKVSVLDLTDVTFIDEAGARVLCAMEEAGVRFIARGVDTKFLLDGLKKKTPSLRRCLCWLSCGKDETEKR